MGLLMTAETKLTLSQMSHEEGSPTPSPPGAPPALITGALRNSVVPLPPVGFGVRWWVIVGGTTVYARIQELGGEIHPGASGWLANRNTGQIFVSPYTSSQSITLPPRPYLKPTAEKIIADGRATRAAVQGWLRVMEA
jgi:hypothetical protein